MVGIVYENDDGVEVHFKCENDECGSIDVLDYNQKFITKEIYIESYKCNKCGFVTENEKSI